MAKRIYIDGIPHRMRRGVLVRIPDEWVGQVTHPQTIRKRNSKKTRHGVGIGKSFKRKCQR